MVDSLVDAAARAAGALPLLQFALAELWEKRDEGRRVIPAAALATTGGVEGALARHADAVLGSLVPAQREIPFGASVVEQARAIIEAQIAAPPPRLSAIPAETKLRDVFITERGDAFVDLSGDIVTKHPGGSLDEIFTVYTLVNALTVNLPAVTRVQILIDGKEVDTLAGHVDLRHPLAKSLEWVVHDTQ